MAPLRGSCLCGTSHFELAAQPDDCSYCHCVICRKLTGSLGGAYGSIPRESFSWVGSDEHIKVFSPTPMTRRYFCGTCGCYMLTEHDAEPQSVFVSLGALDDEISEQPRYRQFTGSTPHWLDINDDLPRHDKWPKEE
jgi:hypothetical protein